MNLFKAYLTRRKLKAIIEYDLSNWHYENYSPEQIMSRFKYEINHELVKEVVKSIKWDVESAAKDLLFIILEDEEFKVGLKDAVRQSIKNKFMEYLDKV